MPPPSIFFLAKRSSGSGPFSSNTALFEEMVIQLLISHLISLDLLQLMMAQRSHDSEGVERALLIDRAPDDLQWIHPDVKMVSASLMLRHQEMIKDME